MTSPQSLDPQSAVVLEHLTRVFPGTVAVDDVSLTVAEGDFVSLLGPSGCGKTTLLRMIAGFEQPDLGRIFVRGQDVTSLPPEKRPTNLVFQRGALFPHRDIFENIAYSLRVQGLPKEAICQRVERLLDLVRLPGFERRRPSQLSGGQAQRVALARALAANPTVLLLDEPLTALDLKLRKEMQLELRTIHRTLGTTFIYVTHDQEEAMVMSDRIVIMNCGRVVQEGTPADIYGRPASIFASQFIGETNLLPAELVSTAAGIATAMLPSGAVIRVAEPLGSRAPGSGLTVSIRPEQLQLVETSDPDANVLVGRVTETVFIGSRLRIRLDVGAGLSMWMEIGPKDRGRLVDGTEVRVGWLVADGRAFAA